MMLRLAARVLLSIACVGSAATIFCWRSQSATAPSLNFTTTSPRQTYVVTLKGQAGPPGTEIVQLDLTGHEVKADGSKHGNLIFSALSMYSGDGYDEGFKALYPDHEWLSDDILEFGQKANFLRREQSDLKITNRTDKNISYAFVRAGKYYLFLIFDLAPKTTRHIPVALQHWEQIVGAEGKFENGAKLGFRDVSFSSTNSDRVKAHYCISITENELEVASVEFEGKKLDGTIVRKSDCSN